MDRELGDWQSQTPATPNTPVHTLLFWLYRKQRPERTCDSQVGGLALLHLLALAAGGRLLAAERACDAHEQAAVAQEEAADIH